MGTVKIASKAMRIVEYQSDFDPLITMFETMERNHFMQPKYRAMVVTDETPEGILKQFSVYEAPSVKSYLTEERT